MQLYLLFVVLRLAHFGDSRGIAVLCWATFYDNGQSVINAVVGEPNDYLPIFAVDLFQPTAYYQMWSLTAPDKTSFQSVAYEATNDLMAASISGLRTLTVHANITLGGFLKVHDLGFLPLSNNIAGLALASNFKLLYWVDTTFQYIGVVQLPTLQWSKVILSDLAIPYSLAVYEAQSYLFWSDIGSKPKIERSSLNGTNRKVIVGSSLNQPISLVIDKQRNALCWLDGILHCSDFDGKDVTRYKLSDKADYFKGFVIYKEIIILGTKTNFFLSYKFNDNGTISNFSSFRHPLFTNTISGSIDSMDVTPPLSNPCASREKSCDHLCFPQQDTYSICGCRFGYSLNSDGTTCNLADIKGGQILVADRSQKMLYQIDANFGSAEAILSFDQDYIENIAYLNFMNESYLYFVLQDKRDIIQYQISNRMKSFLYRSINDVTDLAADQTSGALYVSDVDGKIHVVNSSSHGVVIVTSGGSIINMYLHPQKRLLFYSECSTKSIIELNLENNKEVKRTPVGVCATSMVIDLFARKAYFSDGSSNLYGYDLVESGSRQQLLITKESISGMTMDDDYIYIVENSNYATRVNKQTLAVLQTKPMFTKAKIIQLTDYLQKISSAKTDSPPLGLIIGLSTAGGVLLIALIAFAIALSIIMMRKRSKTKSPYDKEINFRKPDILESSHYEEIMELDTTIEDPSVYIESDNHVEEIKV